MMCIVSQSLVSGFELTGLEVARSDVLSPCESWLFDSEDWVPEETIVYFQRSLRAP